MKQILKFTTSSTDCLWCSSLDTILNEITSPVVITTVEVTDSTNIDLLELYRLYELPTLVLVDNNTEIDRLEGEQKPQRITSWIESIQP